jgi:hypothetical protein
MKQEETLESLINRVVASGKSKEEIAALMGITPTGMRKHARLEVEQGKKVPQKFMAKFKTTFKDVLEVKRVSAPIEEFVRDLIERNCRLESYVEIFLPVVARVMAKESGTTEAFQLTLISNEVKAAAEQRFSEWKSSSSLA